MTPAQKRLRELRDRQSRERGRMAELAQVDELTDELRSELDKIEKATPDLERQIRAAMVGAETEEREAETTETDSPDAEMRERIELRGKAQLTSFLLAAARGRMVDGAEAELCAAAGVQEMPSARTSLSRSTWRRTHAGSWFLLEIGTFQSSNPEPEPHGLRDIVHLPRDIQPVAGAEACERRIGPGRSSVENRA